VAAHAAGSLQFFGPHAHLADPKAFAAFLAPLRKKRWLVYAKRPPTNIQTDPSQVRVVRQDPFDQLMRNGIKEGFDIQIAACSWVGIMPTSMLGDRLR
jgi:hypothetical protein